MWYLTLEETLCSLLDQALYNLQRGGAIMYAEDNDDLIVGVRIDIDE